MEIGFCLLSTLFGAGGAIAVMVCRPGGLIDIPDRRSSHTVPTPKGGGVGILLAFALVSVLTGMDPGFYLPAVGVSLVSLWGDRVELSPLLRLVVQSVCAALFLVSGKMPFAAWPFLILFIAGTANFYNFMDGINGIAGITGVVGFGLLSLFAGVYAGQDALSLVLICIAFSCMGFLPFNVPGARVFMGDVGSVLLGFIFASSVVRLSGSLGDFIILCCFLLPFYADELTTMFLRLKNGENITRPHRSHLYQILANEFSVSHWKVSVCYGILQLAAGVTLLTARGWGTVVTAGFALFFFCCFSAFSRLVRQMERKEIA